MIYCCHWVNSSIAPLINASNTINSFVGVVLFVEDAYRLCSDVREVPYRLDTVTYWWSRKSVHNIRVPHSLSFHFTGTVNGASIVRRLTKWLTRFSCISVMDRERALIFLTVFETKMKCVHIRFARTCNIFRVGWVIVRMPNLPSRNVPCPNSIWPLLIMSVWHAVAQVHTINRGLRKWFCEGVASLSFFLVVMCVNTAAYYCADWILFFVWEKTGSKKKKRRKEEEIERGDYRPTTHKVFSRFVPNPLADESQTHQAGNTTANRVPGWCV